MMGKSMEPLYVIYFFSTWEKLTLTSQLQMLSCLMELQMFSLPVNFWKITIQRFQLCVGFKTLYPRFSMMFLKSQLWIRWLHLIRKYITYLVLAYITNLILYSNQNHMSFTIRTLDYSVAMIPEWLVISLECTDICALERHFLPQSLRMNSTLCQLNQNFPKWYHTFRIIKFGRVSMCYWKLVFLVFGLFVLKIATKQECTSYSNMPKW